MYERGSLGWWGPACTLAPPGHPWAPTGCNPLLRPEVKEMGGLGDKQLGNTRVQFVLGKDKAIYGPWGDTDPEKESHRETQRDRDTDRSRQRECK